MTGWYPCWRFRWERAQVWRAPTSSPLFHPLIISCTLNFPHTPSQAKPVDPLDMARQQHPVTHDREAQGSLMGIGMGGSGPIKAPAQATRAGTSLGPLRRSQSLA